MANEFQHKDPGSTLTSAEFIASDGTGHIFDSQAAGDILYASSTTVLARLAKDANATRVLTNTGTGNIPAWAQVTLTSGVTGTLPVANGGTGITSMASGIATFLGTSSSANLRSALTDETGTGGAVFATSPTLTTPALGTPSALVATNATGTASSLTAGTVTTNANLTGHVTSSGNAAVLGSFTSAQLATALTNETGTGLAVFNGSPALTTPTIGSFANSAHDHADAAGGAAVVSSSATVSGIVELATTAETTAGTDTARAVTPDGLAGSVVFGTRYVQCVVVDSGTDIAEGDGKFFFHVPPGMDTMELIAEELHARVATAGSGSVVGVQLFLNTSTTDASTGNDMLSTELTIDDGELDSSNDSAPVVNSSYKEVNTNDMIRIDVNDDGGDSTIAKGLIVTMGFRLP